MRTQKRCTGGLSWHVGNIGYTLPNSASRPGRPSRADVVNIRDVSECWFPRFPYVQHIFTYLYVVSNHVCINLLLTDICM